MYVCARITYRPSLQKNSPRTKFRPTQLTFDLQRNNFFPSDKTHRIPYTIINMGQKNCGIKKFVHESLAGGKKVNFSRWKLPWQLYGINKWLGCPLHNIMMNENIITKSYICGESYFTLEFLTSFVLFALPAHETLSHTPAGNVPTPTCTCIILFWANGESLHISEKLVTKLIAYPHNY